MARVANTAIKIVAIDGNGEVVPGALFSAFAAGTTTPAAIYSDSGLTAVHDGTANAAGVFAPVYMAAGVYKFDIKDPDTLASLPGYPEDNVPVGGSERYGTVADLEASTEPTRGAGETWEAGGFRFIEATTGATDHDLTTAGGVKLYAQVNETGGVSLRQFARAADSDDTDALQRAVANSVSGDIYLDKGTLNITSLTIDKNVRLIGQGRKNTLLNVTGFTTYDTVKAGIVAKGTTDLTSVMELIGMEIDIQSTEAGQVGLLVTRKTHAQDVYIHDAPSDGINFRTLDPDLEAPYFCEFAHVWSKYNGRMGLRLTENCNANWFGFCQFDRNAEHGVHQYHLGLSGIPQATYNNAFVGGQASYNMMHGYYFQNGSECVINASYAEYNSALDSGTNPGVEGNKGDPKVGAYKNLQLSTSFAKGFFQMGSLGTSTDPELTLGLNTVANNTVYTSGRLVTPFDGLALGYSNVGAGRAINFHGGGSAEHTINFYEGTAIIARLRYNGSPASPSNEIRMEVTSNNGSSWSTLWHGTNNGHLGFYGKTPVAQGAAIATPSGGTIIDTQARTAISSLIGRLKDVGITL